MPLRVLHSGDLHLTEGPRFTDTLRCLEAMVADGEEQGVQLWLIGGDLTNKDPRRQTVLEMNTLDRLFQRMSRSAPVAIVYGNHDREGDLEGFARLSGPHPIVVVAEPTVLSLAGVQIFAFPYPEKRRWLAPHAALAIEEQDRAIELDLRTLLGEWAADVCVARARGEATIFLGHLAIGGSLLAGGERQLPAGQEIELSVGDLETLGCDLTCLSHIHLAQSFASGRIWYAGSPDRANFGEETDIKGWYIFDVAPGRPPVAHRRLSPARRFVTAEVTWALDAGEGAPGWVWTTTLDEIAGAEVRVRINVPQEASATCPTDALEASLRAQGAYSVQLERRSIPKQELRCEAITKAETVEEMLGAFWDSLGAEGPDAVQRQRALTKFQEIKRAAPIVVEDLAA